MQKFDVLIALEGIAEARSKWRTAKREFDGSVNKMMGLLIHEAARNFMSAREVSAASGFTLIRVRALMREHGLDPKSGKRLLSEQAAKALRENAELMGIEPHQMDLMSPLAYLPMGEQMRKELRDKNVSQVISCKDCGLPLTAEEDGLHECEFPETPWNPSEGPHTRAMEGGGKPYCVECSAAIQAWVAYPCRDWLNAP